MKKSLFIVLFFVFTTLSSLLLISCNEKIPIQDIQFTQTELELFKGQGTYLTLKVTPGNANNYTLEWSSSDTSVATINKRGRVETLNYGNAVITCQVVGTDLKATCDITVTDGQIFDMYVDESSVIKDYFVGQSFNNTGMSVWVKYQSGVEKEVSSEQYQIIVPETLNIGDTLKIVYDEYEYEIPLNVIEDYVTDIEVVSNPIKTEYFIGETFDDTGLVLNLVYASGKTEPLTSNYTYKTSPFTYNDSSITINYENYTAEIPLTIKANYTVSIYSNLQSVIDSASYGESIMITGTHYNVGSITIPKSKNLTIYGIISQDSYTTITPNNDNPAFIIIDDIDDDKNYQTTIANININSRDTNESSLIVVNSDNSTNNLNNFTLTLDNVTMNYKNIAIDIEKNQTLQNNLENLVFNILNCNFTSSTSTQSAINVVGLQNSKINITNSTIKGYNGLSLIDCLDIDTNISNSIIDSANFALNLTNLSNSNLKIINNTYLAGFNSIYLNGQENLFELSNSYLTASQNKEDVAENCGGVIHLEDAINNTLNITECILTNKYTNEYTNAIINIVLIEDGENNQSANNDITFLDSLLNFNGNGEKFKIDEASLSSTIIENNTL